MFKLVVLFFALLAVSFAAPKPGLLGYSYGLPSAVSHQSRVDYHSSPLVVAHAAPVLSYAAHAPVVAAHAAWPAAVSHQSRYDIHRSAAVVAAVPTYGYGYGYAAPALHAW